MAKQNYDELASKIIELVGGPENIKKVIHCITRLRFYLHDEKKANTEAIQALAGVAGAVYNSGLGQYQVVIGPAVADVYDCVIKQLGSDVAGDDAQEAAASAAPKSEGPTSFLDLIKKGFQTLIGTITGSMIPVIGLLAAGGMLNGFLALFSEVFHLISAKSDTFIIIQSMAMAPFYFMPILVGFSAAKQLKSDPLVVAAIGAFLVKPEMAAFVNVKHVEHFMGISLNANFFGLPISIPSYAYSIFPVIFAAWLARPVGNWLKDHLPASIRSIFQPLFTIFIVGSVVLVVMGPAIIAISAAISFLINQLLQFNYAISGLLIGGLYQVLVIFGLHWMVVPLVAQEIAQHGQSNLNALINFTMIAQGAGALAVAFKTKVASLKGLAGSSALSAFAGITEPAVYGINLKYGRVFWMSNVGGAVGGLIAGMFNLHMYGFTGSLIGFPSFASAKDNPNNLWIFCLAAVATIIVSFAMVYFFGFKDSDTQNVKAPVEKKNVFKEAVADEK